MTTTGNPAPARETVETNAMTGTVVGLDIGGTKTRGVRFENGAPVMDVTVASANVQNVSRDTAAANIAELFSNIGDGAVDQVYAGAGGIDTEDDARALTALITPFAPAARITVVHDSRLLLAAGGVSTGVAVIAGTGSAAWGRNSDGDEARTGGWGYLLGDEGSGYWLGREAVRHSLRRLNQGHEPDELTVNLLTACDADDPNKLIALFHSPLTGRQYWAKLARLVVDAAADGHEPSRQMLAQAGKDLANLTTHTLAQLGIAGPVILGGGLGMNVPRLQAAFREALAGKGITDVRALDQDPIFGINQLIAEQLSRKLW